MATSPKDHRTSAAFDRVEVLSRAGSALGKVKADRRLTLPDMEELLGKSEDQVARYIAGDDMPLSIWFKALDIWPELAARFEETTAERIAQSRQRDLNFQIRKRA